jgi:hypothetical protein
MATLRDAQPESGMSTANRLAFAAITVLLIVLAVSPKAAQAQTPEQMEYERQQREYRQQQEQQRQEQQRQQELMNENARRQQEESSRLNAPMSQDAAPAYQGAAPQGGPGGMRPPAVQSSATAATAAAKWVDFGTVDAFGGTEIYYDPITMQRSGNMVKMWEMWDFKTTQDIGGQRVLSVSSRYEYDCKSARRRMLSTAGFSGHGGKGVVVDTGTALGPWESLPPGYIEELWKVACGS